MKRIFNALIVGLLLGTTAQAALPTVVFNSSTGSDTAASGAGPATALSGTGAAVASSTTVTLTVDGPDLSGVATDGSAVLWVDTSSGLQFSKVTAVDNTAKTVTVETTYAVTEGSRNWGIGGKRATFNDADSRTLFANALSGWIIETETDQTITTSAITFSASGKIIVRGSTGSRKTLNTTANTYIFDLTAVNRVFRNLGFTCSNGTKSNAFCFRQNNSVTGWVVLEECVLGDATNTANSVVTRNTGTVYWTFNNCELKNFTSVGFSVGAAAVNVTFRDCWIHDCASHGLACTTAQQSVGFIVSGSVIEDNGGDGINLTDGILTCVGNTIDGNASDGIELATSGIIHILKNNQITNNGAYGVVGISTSDLSNAINENNNYYGNATAARSNLSAGVDDLALDPGYVDAGNNNFATGTNTKALAYPIGGTLKLGANNSGTYSYLDVGASQRQESAASSPTSAVGIGN